MRSEKRTLLYALSFPCHCLVPGLFYTGHFVKREAKGVQILGSGWWGYYAIHLASRQHTLPAMVLIRYPTGKMRNILAFQPKEL